MPDYKLIIQVSGVEEIPFTLKITGSDESYPQDHFKRHNISSKLTYIINQAHREVSQNQLNYIINEWINGIKQNRRVVTVKAALERVVADTTNPARESFDNDSKIFLKE
jgi:hypothetical protein